MAVTPGLNGRRGEFALVWSAGLAQPSPSRKTPGIPLRAVLTISIQGLEILRLDPEPTGGSVHRVRTNSEDHRSVFAGGR